MFSELAMFIQSVIRLFTSNIRCEFGEHPDEERIELGEAVSFLVTRCVNEEHGHDSRPSLTLRVTIRSSVASGSQKLTASESTPTHLNVRPKPLPKRGKVQQVNRVVVVGIERIIECRVRRV